MAANVCPDCAARDLPSITAWSGNRSAAALFCQYASSNTFRCSMGFSCALMVAQARVEEK
jgi:hypothetical protein